ncbi:solute carrier family 12 cation cotransporter [Holotrichia oblita]|uniref:Solute carrier family 12 cation cotransporter n=1 Tax=Holotrichia oblita TaxID=644536 RepID=A0ACB9SSA7_HOLOL|nr:solute carrier family 12 cation cotransporter [Holotrichia oblita]
MFDFLIGTAIGPFTDEQRAKGFSGFSLERFQTNFPSSYRPQGNVDYNFFQVFAIFFPSVTGIQAGANISGDLKDPASAIPKGTLLALLISMTSYVTFVIFAGGAAMRDASGSLSDLANGTLTDCAANYSCTYGLFNSYSFSFQDVNWGSTTQAQTYKTALNTAHRLINTGEHVKLYEPQILVLCGTTHARPALLDFANFITKNNSLLVVGDIVERKLSHKVRTNRKRMAYSWLNDRKIKAFYTVVDGVSFETGAKVLLQSSGIGKLAPNVLMMGYKNNWRTCNSQELISYFNVLHAAFDNRLSVVILRVADGLDYSKIMEEDEGVPSTDLSMPISRAEPISTIARQLMHADSNLNISHLVASEGNISSNVSSNTTKSYNLTGKNRSKKPLNPDKLIYHGDTVPEIQRTVLDKVSIFRKKQDKGTIDVWWLYDDGGLTMLLPYIISTRSDWANSKLRVFALTNNTLEAEEEKNMANLLSKFRLEYSSLKMVNISDKPSDSTIQFFDSLLEHFKTPVDVKDNECKVSEIEIAALQEKTYRQLRLRELLLEHSRQANLVVMSLPMPRKGTVSAPLYMAWLEALTKDLPPYLLVRGNQQSVLTFYS